jgi:hypothetical protein
MPCALGPRLETMSEEEQAQVYKATWWADLVTASEWPALLGHEGFSPSARSRLKKKSAGLLIALGRIAVLNPELFAEVVERATTTYEEQTETEYPRASIAAALVRLQTFQPHPRVTSFLPGRRQRPSSLPPVQVFGRGRGRRHDHSLQAPGLCHLCHWLLTAPAAQKALAGRLALAARSGSTAARWAGDCYICYQVSTPRSSVPATSRRGRGARDLLTQTGRALAASAATRRNG